MERVRKYQPTEQADPPQGHFRASGTKHLSYEVLGSYWHLRSQNHWPWQKGARFYRIPPHTHTHKKKMVLTLRLHLYCPGVTLSSFPTQNVPSL